MVVVVVVVAIALADVAAGPESTTSGSSAATLTGGTKESTTTITAGLTTVATAANGTTFYMDNVTSIMWAEDPGTFHFDNGSVIFHGVTFQTICTDQLSGCPGVPPTTPGVTYTISSGAGITLNVTFPDHSSEMISGGFPTVPVRFSAYSHHTDPQAGILIVYTNSSPEYKSYLLVST